MDEYFCPKCGAILNDQYGFDPSKGTWRCTECGMYLMDDIYITVIFLKEWLGTVINAELF